MGRTFRCVNNECNRHCLGHPNECCGGLGEDDVPQVRFWRNPLDSARTELVMSPFVPFVRSVVKKSGNLSDETWRARVQTSTKYLED